MKKSDEVKRKFIESLKGNGFKVKTDTGWSEIKYCHKTIEYTMWELKTSRHFLECADTHIVFRSNLNNEVLDEVYVNELIPGDIIACNDGYDIVQSVTNLNYDESMFDLELNDENHRFFTNNILSHNSATTRAYLLWYSIFNENKTIAMLGNKLSLAKEQLQLLRESYINLPYWMQPGVVAWNKLGVEFSHGTRILVAATSPDNIRGLSINCVTGDGVITVRDKITGEIKEITMEQLKLDLMQCENNILEATEFNLIEKD